MRRTHEDYVCGYCFRPIEKCICNHQPHELILIDKQLQNVIQILNDKFYRTLYCCEGHYNPNKNKTDIYISFDDALAPQIFPAKWKVITNQIESKGAFGKISIHSDIKYNTTDPEKKLTKFLTEQKKKIKELTEWAESLPVCKENEYV